jgi:hypothetical protein
VLEFIGVDNDRDHAGSGDLVEKQSPIAWTRSAAPERTSFVFDLAASPGDPRWETDSIHAPSDNTQTENEPCGCGHFAGFCRQHLAA